jgi:hypothetical protein
MFKILSGAEPFLHCPSSSFFEDVPLFLPIQLEILSM